MNYSKEELDAIFAKGNKIRGKDPDRYRKDACGNEIYRQSYGKESPMGWEVVSTQLIRKSFKQRASCL